MNRSLPDGASMPPLAWGRFHLAHARELADVERVEADQLPRLRRVEQSSSRHCDLAARRPDEVDHGVPRIRGDPSAARRSPSSFFVFTNSSVTLAMTRSFCVSRWRSSATVRSSVRCSVLVSFANAAAPILEKLLLPGVEQGRAHVVLLAHRRHRLPSSRTFLRSATLSAALCCRYRRARLLPMSLFSSCLPDDYIPAG